MHTLAYCIHAKLCQEHQGLALSIHRVNNAGKYEPACLAKTQIQALSLEPKELKAWKFLRSCALIKQEYFILDAEDSLEFLELIHGRSCLFFQGKYVFCDLLGRAKFSYDLEESEKGVIMVHGKLSWGTKSQRLSQVDFFVSENPYFFMSGGLLKKVDAKVHERYIRKVSSQGFFTLENAKDCEEFKEKYGASEEEDSFLPLWKIWSF